MSLTICTAASPKDSIIIYDEEHPLIYEDAWDLWPYVFLNENGEPDGYNIDLLKMIFKELDIPYVVKLRPTLEAQADLKNKKSDLMLRMDANFSRNNASYGKSIVQLFTHSIVTPKSKNITIRNIKDLASHSVIVHEGSFSHHLIEEQGWAKKIILYDEMQEAIQKVSAEDDGIIIWNTMSLKWLMQKFQTDNLRIDPINLTHGEYKFFANDQHLLAQMDSVYSYLRANDRLTRIQNKWFYPERKETGIPSWIWDLIKALSLIAVSIIIYYIIYKVRERKMTRVVRRRNERLSMILTTSHIGLWTFDVKKQIFTMMNKEGKPEKEYTPLEFSQLYSTTSDFKQLTNAIKQIIDGKSEVITLHLKAKPNEEATVERIYTTTLSILRHDKNHQVQTIICSENDITEDLKRHEKIKDTMLRYQSVFNTAMVDMVYYDKDGYIVGLNEKSAEGLGITTEEIKKRKISIKDVLGIDDFDFENMTTLYMTQIFKSPDDERILNQLLKREEMYYELKLTPVRDQQNKLIAIFGTGHNITETVHSYRQLKENTNKLKQANDEVREYINNIDYVLKIGGISLGKYNLRTHTLTIYSEIDKEQFVLTQARAMAFVNEQSKKQAQRLLHKMDNKQAGNFHDEIKTNLRHKGGIPLYVQLHFIPIYENGVITEYFGMFRDISEVKDIESKLKLETVRAQEVEVVKNAFLHNMSYEIRTPLNSVVGFSELFEMEHSPEDETIYIREIKKSSVALLKLINDILFLSRLDAGMITLTQKPVDFAAIFEKRCEATWSNIKKPGVKYLTRNPYKKLILEIDEPKVSLIMDKIITNAVTYTTSGTILARYDYIGEQLVISIEDTGKGIPEESIKHIFERFVTGANTGVGLGLSICHELIRYMGGNIKLKSKVGKGTTVWFSLPCKVLETERP